MEDVFKNEKVVPLTLVNVQSAEFPLAKLDFHGLDGYCFFPTATLKGAF